VTRWASSLSPVGRCGGTWYKSPMLTSLVVHGFRVLGDVSCTFERFTIIGGPNGCGKSTLLRVLELTAMLGGTGPVRDQATIQLNEAPSGSSATVTVLARDPSQPPWERCWVKRPDGLSASWTLNGSNVDEASAQLQATPPKHVLRPRFSAGALRAASPINNQRSILTGDGSGLAGLLADWKLEDDPRLGLVLEQLQRIVPQVQAIVPTREGPQFALYFLMGPDKRKVPAQHMSDGTLYALALLTMLQSVGGESALLLLDDIDHDLHPRAQEELIKALRAVLDGSPDLQIVATSHSPYCMDHMRYEEVRLMTLDDGGLAALADLTAHPDFKRWRGILTTGEFWSSIGEDWIVGRSEGKEEDDDRKGGTP
jgi:predicted ATPase